MPYLLSDHLNYFKQHQLLFETYNYDKSNKLLLKEDNSIPMRDSKREKQRIEKYLNNLDSNYYEEIEEYVSILPEMSEQCRAVVLIPSRFEVNYLFNVLNLLATQYAEDNKGLSTDQYEVLILNNYFKNEKNDGTEEYFDQWKKENEGRSRKFFCITKLFDTNEKFPLTSARRLLSDITLMRAVRRKYDVPLYLIPEDADTIWMDSKQIFWMINKMDTYPWLDALRGQQDRCPWIMRENDLLVTIRRSWNLTEIYCSRESLWPNRNSNYDYNWNRNVTGGWNTIFSAEVYAQIGGYTPERLVGEDVDIGEKISCLRGKWHQDIFIPQVASIGKIGTRSEGAIRRWLLQVSRGIEPYNRKNNYNNFFDHKIEKIIKVDDVEALFKQAVHVSRLSYNNCEIFEDSLNKDLRFTMNIRKSEVDAYKQYKNVLCMMGFFEDDFNLSNGRLKVLNWTNYIRKLGKFKINNSLEKKYNGLRESWRNDKKQLVSINEHI